MLMENYHFLQKNRKIKQILENFDFYQGGLQNVFEIPKFENFTGGIKWGEILFFTLIY